MKNNNIILITFLFVFIFASKIISANEFTFETEEIKVTNNANITTALNGTATSLLHNFFIKAERFEYNNKLSQLKAFNGFAKYPAENIEIIADNFEYDEKKLLFKANGNVLIKDFSNKISIRSESIFYNVKNKIISSVEETKIEDDLGNTFISENFLFKINNKLIKINNATLIDLEKNKYEIKKAFIDLNINKLIGKDISIDFNNAEFEKENEPRLKGNSISSNTKETVIKKGVFTTCKKSDDCPPWQFSAEEIKHDKNKKTIYYKNAWLKLYDKPVFYFPRFFHPDPSVKRQSGFLMPTFENSTASGTSFNVPYYLVLGNNKDMTISPRFYGNDKLLIQSEYRMVNSKSENLFDFSIMSEADHASKSHFFSESKFKVNLNNFNESEVTFDLQQSSNDTYLKTHKLKSPIINNYNLLTSSVGLSGYREDLAFDVNFKVYEDLNKSNNDRFEFIYPAYNISKQLNNFEDLDGSITFSSRGFLKNYDTNIYETVAINDLTYNSSPLYSNSGFKNNFNILLRNINTDSKKSKKYKDTADYKFASIIEHNTSYPLKKELENGYNILKPKISLKYSPNNNKNLKDTDRRIDVNNVFNLERLGINDAVEGGTSLTYGLDFLKANKEDKEVLGAKIANILRFEENSNLPRNSSLGQKTSDIVGEVNFTPNENFNLNYDFSLDENLADTSYQLLSTEFSVNNFITKFEYLNQNNNKNSESYLTNTTTYIINDTKNFTFETRENKKTKLTEFYNLIYQYRNDCLIAAIEYNKDYYTDRDLKPDETIFLKLTIMPFGETNTPNLIK